MQWQQLRGLVLAFDAVRASVAGSYPTETKWLRCQTLKKVLVWTWACASIAVLRQVSHKRIRIECCSNHD